MAALHGFGVRAEQVTYAPVGYGDYHWHVVDDGGRRWFATVSDLTRKSAAGLRRAMETAAVLRERDGLDFVVAPVRSRDGDPLVTAGPRHGVTLFPHQPGTPGAFGDELAPADQDRLLELLADLHARTPPEQTPVASTDVPGRDRLEQLLADPGTGGGPFSAQARELLRTHAETVRASLAEFDRLAAHVRGRDTLVVTHGEPHPGNLIRRHDGRLMLVDWDTVGLAVPERDLAVARADPAGYTRLTGREVDEAAIAFHRLRWALTDVAEFAELLCGPHEVTPDTLTARRGFAGTLADLRRSSPGTSPPP